MEMSEGIKKDRKRAVQHVEDEISNTKIRLEKLLEELRQLDLRGKPS